jgi:hypothetical protein
VELASALFGCALEVLQPGAERAIEGGLHGVGLRGDRIAFPRLGGPDQDDIVVCSRLQT